MFPPPGGGRSQHGLVSQAQAGPQSGQSQPFPLSGRNISAGRDSTLTGTSRWTRWSSRTSPCRPPPVRASLPTSSLTSPALPTSRKLRATFLLIYISLLSSRTVKPHFLLIRQNLRDGNENYKKLLLGFRYSGVGSVNSIQSIYNFQVSPGPV